MLVCKLRILIHQANSHHKVLSNAFGVLLGQSLQLIAGDLIKLITGDIVIDPWVIVMWSNHT